MTRKPRIFLPLPVIFAILTGLTCLSPIFGQGTSRGGERGSFAVNWDGVWTTSYGEMVLAQDGLIVRGTYNGVTGRIEGNTRGNILDFTWSESPNRSDPAMNGPGEFTMQGSGGSFEGWWESEAYAEHEEWVGNRTGDREIIGTRAPVEYCLWRGSWETSDGSIVFEQSIDSPEVSGEFISGMSYGSFEGTTSGWLMEFAYSGDDGDGTGSFEMSSDLAGFIGHFVSDEAPDEIVWAGEFRSTGGNEDFSGIWSTDFGEMGLTHDLQSGYAIGSVSRYRDGNDDCEIAGRVVGNCFLFTWSLTGLSSEESGSSIIRLEKSGNYFKGIWISDVAGTGELEWSGTRQPD